MVNIYGFALLRNGVKYDYPFRQSLISLSGVCRKIHLALGKSDDGTEKALEDLDFLHIIPTVWDENLRKGGIIFSQQTNIALNSLRDSYKDQENAWGVYLQCDEVLHERDYKQIVLDIEKANSQGYDAVSFRYFHFWQSHSRIAINKKWYPCEIRAVKLNSKAQSFGDAQGFNNFGKVYKSDVHIFHYGHIRDNKKYAHKKKDMLSWYHLEDKLPKYRRREKAFDRKTYCINYFGGHPLVMKERIISLKGIWELDYVNEVFILADPKDYSNISEKIRGKVHWISSCRDIPFKDWKNLVIPRPSWWQKIVFPSRVPQKMYSKLSQNWPNDTLLILKLSEKMVGTRS